MATEGFLSFYERSRAAFSDNNGFYCGSTHQETIMVRNLLYVMKLPLVNYVDNGCYEMDP